MSLSTQLVLLGKSGIRTSLVGMGTGTHGWMRSSNQTRLGKRVFTALVRYAYERGIRFFDAADLYGTHTYLRDALSGIPREDIVIQTKIWFKEEPLPDRTTDATAALERFRQELGTDYIDVVLLHGVTDGSWPDDLKRMCDQLSEAKERGVIRAHGVSVHSVEALRAAIASDWVDVILARINHRGVEMDDDPYSVAELLSAARSAGKGVIGMKVFGEGAFKEVLHRFASLYFILAQRCVDAFVVGFEHPSEIEETLALTDTALVLTTCIAEVLKRTSRP